MRSLRSRLTLSLALGLGLLLVGGGIWLYTLLSSRLLHEFDQVLMAKARALISLTERENDKIEFEYSEHVMPEFSRSERPEYFSLWLASGTLLDTSASLNDHELPRQPGVSPTPQFRDVVLPNGASGRLVQVAFVPQIDLENNDKDDKKESEDTGLRDQTEPQGEPEEAVSDREVDPREFPEQAAILVVARQRTQLDGLIRTLHLALVGGILGLLIAMVVLVRVAIRIGLQPLDDVQYQVSQLDVETLATGVQVTTQTRELIPVVNQLNALMRRLEAAFVRERQFSSDVAHELRTPLAELRTLAEVGQRWPEDRDAVVDYFSDAKAICEQMEGVVISLLTLARCERGAQPVQETQINLLEAVESSWLTVTRLAQEKSQVFECDISPTLELTADPDMFSMVLNNLLANAVFHSPPKSTIRCEASNGGLRSRLTISNPAETLSSEDLPQMFERFWRKDSARSSGSHSGLGLAIVKAFSELLGFDVQSQIDRQQIVSITLSF